MKTISLLPLVGKGSGSTLTIWLNVLIVVQGSILKFVLLCSSPKIKWSGGQWEVGGDEKRGRQKRNSVSLSFLFPIFPPEQRKLLLLCPGCSASHSVGPHRQASGIPASRAGELNQLSPRHTAAGAASGCRTHGCHPHGQGRAVLPGGVTERT